MSKKKKWFIWLVIIAAVIGGIVYWRSRPKEITFVTQEVKRGTVAQTVSVTGELVPETQADLAFRRGGTIEEIKVDAGDKVAKGQLLAAVDEGTLPEQLREAEAQVRSQKETYDNVKRRKSTFNRDQRLAQKAVVEAAEAARDAVRSQFEDIKIVAPFDGVITKKNFQAGEIITANVALLTLVGEGGLKVEANVPESDIVEVKTGQTADIVFDALNADDKFVAKVDFIDPASTVVQDVVYYRTKFKLEKSDDRLKPGMSCDVDIHIVEKQNVLYIPERAIRIDGDKKTIRILKPENQTETVEVKTGLSGDGGIVEIMSGIKEGDKVVVSETQK